MLSSTFCLIFISILAVISWTGAESTENDQAQNVQGFSLCNDTRISDETVTQLEKEQEICFKEFKEANEKYVGYLELECYKESGYSWENLNVPRHRRVFLRECMKSYPVCMKYKQHDTTRMTDQDKEMREIFRTAFVEHVKCIKEKVDLVFPPLSE